jgi:hypothetical protein
MVYWQVHKSIFDDQNESSLYFLCQFGTDDIISLIDGWGPENENPVKIQSFLKEQSLPLAFLIAGVGDGEQSHQTSISGKPNE